MASTSVTSRFNDGVQFDLLFLEDGVVAHILDLCIRWVQGAFVESREPHHVLAALTHLWNRQYGAPQFIVSDQEGAFLSDEGGIWADRRGIQL